MEHPDYEYHFSTNEWAKDKETGQVPVAIHTSLNFGNDTDIKAMFGETGKLQEAFDLYVKFLERNNCIVLTKSVAI